MLAMIPRDIDIAQLEILHDPPNTVNLFVHFFR